MLTFLANDGDSPPPLPERRPTDASPHVDTSEPRNGSSRVCDNNNFKNSPLPSGYEMKKTQQGQVYFVHVPTGNLSNQKEWKPGTVKIWITNIWITETYG